MRERRGGVEEGQRREEGGGGGQRGAEERDTCGYKGGRKEGVIENRHNPITHTHTHTPM